MGRASQERMTGRAYEERVKRAKKQGIVSMIKKVLRINKPRPTRFANVRRHGNAPINPRLMK